MNREEMQTFMEEALKKANAIQNATVEYEVARSSLEAIEAEGTEIIVMVTEPGTNVPAMTLTTTDLERDRIRTLLHDSYENEMKAAVKTIEELTEKNTTKIKEKEKPSFINEEFDQVVDDMIKSMDKENKKEKVAPVQLTDEKKKKSTEIISDEQLKIEYYKNKKKINQIADEYNVPVGALYKRIEKIRNGDKESTSKEGVCRH